MVRTRKSVQAHGLVGKPAARELVPTMPGTTARWHTHDYPGPYCRWHYHPEFEIHLIQHGTGRSIVGEHITNRDVVFQFHPQWIRDCQQLLPEL
jgi:hypothetical protein